MKPDKIYVVHYTKLVERLTKLIPTLNASGVDYEIITKWDKEDITSDNIVSLFDSNKENFEKKISALWDGNVHKYRHLNMPEISCTLKHFEAIRKVAEECPNFGLIVEDDVIFDQNFAVNFIQKLQDTPDDWDAVFMGIGCGLSFVTSKLKQEDHVKGGVFRASHPATNCAEAYMLKPSMAKKIYDGLPFSLVSDWEIAYQLYKNNANVYWWFPALATQGSKNGMFKSELDLGQR